MMRLNILLAVMVVMAGALFSGHEALAKVLTGTPGEDTLVGTDRYDRLSGGPGQDFLKGNSGNDTIWASRGNDKIHPGAGEDKVYAGYGDDLIYARDKDDVDYIDCGPGFDKVETIHRDDETLSNCERAVGPDRGDI